MNYFLAGVLATMILTSCIQSYSLEPLLFAGLGSLIATNLLVAKRPPEGSE